MSVCIKFRFATRNPEIFRNIMTRLPQKTMGVGLHSSSEKLDQISVDIKTWQRKHASP
jgi:hypothetical protein